MNNILTVGKLRAALELMSYVPDDTSVCIFDTEDGVRNDICLNSFDYCPDLEILDINTEDYREKTN